MSTVQLCRLSRMSQTNWPFPYKERVRGEVPPEADIGAALGTAGRPSTRCNPSNGDDSHHLNTRWPMDPVMIQFIICSGLGSDDNNSNRLLEGRVRDEQ